MSRTLLRHAPQSGYGLVGVVVDQHLALGRMQPVQAPHMLRERSSPCDRHREEQGVEAGVVERCGRTRFAVSTPTTVLLVFILDPPVCL